MNLNLKSSEFVIIFDVSVIFKIEMLGGRVLWISGFILCIVSVIYHLPVGCACRIIREWNM